MKKVILIVAILVVLVFVLCSCVDTQEEKPEEYYHIDNFKTIQKQGSLSVICDEDTGVMYLIINGYKAMAMTPLYNADGTLKIYKQDKDE